MNPVLDFFSNQSTVASLLKMYAFGGWIILVSLLLYGGFFMLYVYRRNLYTKDWNFILLAIDIPAINIQTPKAVEQLFTHVFSVMDTPTIASKYWHGWYQYQFSFEIISIGGYIQFLVRTLDKFQDVVEAAVYAQYPDAEIIEVEDYVNNVPDKYPNDTHQIWAADFVLTQHYAFPIRSYHDFEHSISKDTVLKDSMGTFLESFSRIRTGEQLWFQIIIEPLEEWRWKDECIKKIKEIIGEKSPKKKSPLDFITNNPIIKEVGKSFEELNAQITGGLRSEDDGTNSKNNDDGPPNQILYLTPGKKKLVEAMEEKISKIGFETKMRAVYVAPKEIYNPSRCINSLVGAVNQFTIPTSNSILPKHITKADYFFADYRKNLRRTEQMHAYKTRNPWMGKNRYVLNIEELATLWHFPMSHVATPRVQKAATKAAEPPTGLPVESVVGLPVTERKPVVENKEKQSEKRSIKTDTGEEIIFDDFG